MRFLSQTKRHMENYLLYLFKITTKNDKRFSRNRVECWHSIDVVFFGQFQMNLQQHVLFNKLFRLLKQKHEWDAR